MKKWFLPLLSVAFLLIGTMNGLGAISGIPAILGRAELIQIVGGNITDCQTAAIKHPIMPETGSWQCGLKGTYSCTNQCSACLNLTQAECTSGNFVCWYCGVKGTADDQTKLTECLLVVGGKSGSSCTDMGSMTGPCPSITQLPCEWDIVLGCRCKVQFIRPGFPCPRTNCQNQPNNNQQ